MDDYKIVHEGDHYVAYHNGEFFCSGDTRTEVEREIENN